MQDDEGAIETLPDQADKIRRLADVDPVGIDALALQPCEYSVAAVQRDLALGRRAAEQHRDLAKLFRTAHTTPLRIWNFS